MTNKEYIEYLNNDKKKLKDICYYFKLDYNYYDDAIQDLYLLILNLKDVDKYTIDDKPNYAWVFTVFKNLIFFIKKNNNKMFYESICDKDYILNTDFYNNYYDDIDKKDKLEFIDKYISELKINNMSDWFKKTIIEFYINNDFSIRKLSQILDIPFHTIQPIIFKFKKDIKSKYNNIKI